MSIVQPQKAADLTKEADLSKPDLGLGRFFSHPHRWAMEPKVDGCRILLELHPTGNKVWSVHNGKARDVTNHFPHLRDAIVTTEDGAPSEDWDGVTLDGELLGNGLDGEILSAATSLLVSSPTNAIAKQHVYGPAWFMVFDVVDLGSIKIGDIVVGTGVQQWAYEDRRLALEVIVPPLADAASFASGIAFEKFHRENQDIKTRKYREHRPVQLISSFDADVSLLTTFRDGEGFMFKDRSGAYWPGKKDASGWFKFKWLSTCDAFIVDYKNGEKSLEGQVGSVTVALLNPDGTYLPVAKVGVFTAEERAKMTAPDGTLKQEYYMRVMAFSCQGMGTGGWARHPRFEDWRPDKTPADCTLDQLDSIPKI